jgi:T6SS, Phospholipase effector Tle1-like, catalytic domain
MPPGASKPHRGAPMRASPSARRQRLANLRRCLLLPGFGAGGSGQLQHRGTLTHTQAREQHHLPVRELKRIVAGTLISAAVYVFTHFKWAYELFDEDRKKSFRTIHFNELWMQFYDYDLNPNVAYARHAISIDENRKSFKRVPWQSTKETSRDAYGIQWFEQVWFAGVHSDIGGGYSENESRLSDIALDWMLNWATVVPNGLKYDQRVLKLSPYPEGMQHDEVRTGFGLTTRFTGYTWPEQRRTMRSDAVVHRSVYRRFDLKAVQVYDVMIPYRPATLRTHKDFEAYYKQGAPPTAGLRWWGRKNLELKPYGPTTVPCFPPVPSLAMWHNWPSRARPNTCRDYWPFSVCALCCKTRLIKDMWPPLLRARVTLGVEEGA